MYLGFEVTMEAFHVSFSSVVIVGICIKAEVTNSDAYCIVMMTQEHIPPLKDPPLLKTTK